MEPITINITAEEVARRNARIVASCRMEQVLPLPVLVLLQDGAFLPIMGITLQDAYENPELFARGQLLFGKWLLEHIPCDNDSVGAAVNFGCAGAPSALGCEVVDRYPSRPAAKPWVRSEQDLLRLEKMDIIEGGLNGKSLRAREAMMRVSKQYPLQYAGGEIFYPLENPGLRGGSEGPFTLACEIAGNQEFIFDCIERPDFAHRMLDIVTEKEITWIEFVKRELGASQDGLFMMDDLAPYLSPDLYEEFALPYEKRIREHFGGYCSFHFCLMANHLLHYLRDELRIDEYSGFKPGGPAGAFHLEMQPILEQLGNRLCLSPDPDPVQTTSMDAEELYHITYAMAQRLPPYRGCKLLVGALDGCDMEQVLNLRLVAQALQDAADSHESQA